MFDEFSKIDNFDEDKELLRAIEEASAELEKRWDNVRENAKRFLHGDTLSEEQHYYLKKLDAFNALLLGGVIDTFTVKNRTSRLILKETSIKEAKGNKKSLYEVGQILFGEHPFEVVDFSLYSENKEKLKQLYEISNSIEDFMYEIDMIHGSMYSLRYSPENPYTEEVTIDRYEMMYE